MAMNACSSNVSSAIATAKTKLDSLLAAAQWFATKMDEHLQQVLKDPRSLQARAAAQRVAQEATRLVSTLETQLSALLASLRQACNQLTTEADFSRLREFADRVRDAIATGIAQVSQICGDVSTKLRIEEHTTLVREEAVKAQEWAQRTVAELRSRIDAALAPAAARAIELRKEATAQAMRLKEQAEMRGEQLKEKGMQLKDQATARGIELKEHVTARGVELKEQVTAKGVQLKDEASAGLKQATERGMQLKAEGVSRIVKAGEQCSAGLEKTCPAAHDKMMEAWKIAAAGKEDFDAVCAGRVVAIGGMCQRAATCVYMLIQAMLLFFMCLLLTPKLPTVSRSNGFQRRPHDAAALDTEATASSATSS